MSPSSLRARALPSAWRFALVGAVASLPVAVVLNRTPNSEATVGGSIMIVGAFVAGVIATNRSTAPDAAGFRAGLLAGVVGVSSLVVRAVSDALGGSAAAWPLSRVGFFVFAGVLFLFVAPLFGLVCGRVGGWMTTTVVSLVRTATNES
jgi:hypothetical protein